MLKLYFYNNDLKMAISSEDALYSSDSQALELLDLIDNNYNSYLVIFSANQMKVQFTKYNKFVWNIEIPHQSKNGSYQIFLTPNKAKRLIEDLYKGFNPLKINGLMFEKK